VPAASLVIAVCRGRTRGSGITHSDSL
jgi:hypothetical protein